MLKWPLVENHLSGEDVTIRFSTMGQILDACWDVLHTLQCSPPLDNRSVKEGPFFDFLQLGKVLNKLICCC